MKRGLSFIFFLLLVSCNSSEKLPTNNITQGSNTPPPASSGRSFARWPNYEFPLNIKISSLFTAQEQVSLEEAANQWENINPLLETPLFSFQSLSEKNTYTNLDDFYDDEFGIYFSEINSSVLAFTQYFGYRKSDARGQYVELVHADIVFNFRDHRFATVPTDEHFDLASVAVHELGHFLGLPHIAPWEGESVMHPNIDEEEIKRLTTNFDDELMQENYSSTGRSFIQALEERSELVRGIIEIRKNDLCLHYENNLLTDWHFYR
jgi:hypothetical protein